MAVVIRLMRAGAKKRPFYRIVAADSRRQRDGRFLEIVGHYDPLTKPFTLKVDQDAVKSWIEKGAQPSEQVASLLRTLDITAARPSKPTKKAADATAKKVPVKRRKPRKVTERRAKAKVARKKKAANPKKAKPKKK